jgi:hypothetical protein
MYLKFNYLIKSLNTSNYIFFILRMEDLIGLVEGRLKIIKKLEKVES